MSAAVNRPHDVYSSHPHLPLTGELHPLRREFERLLAMGNVVALSFALLACSIVYFWPREAVVIPDLVKEHKIVDPLPRVDVKSGRNDTRYEPPPPVVTLGTYVPGEQDSMITELPAGGGNGEGEPIEGRDPFGGWSLGDSLVFPEPTAPPEAHDWWDEDPVFLSYTPRVYPDMVREAGIDGTVVVRVLVGVNGKVKDAYAVEGPAALREAALESARSSLFKPALARGHPVEVWVFIPIVFEIRDRH